jgi:hypothetical protein
LTGFRSVVAAVVPTNGVVVVDPNSDAVGCAVDPKPKLVDAPKLGVATGVDNGAVVPKGVEVLPKADVVALTLSALNLLQNNLLMVCLQSSATRKEQPAKN